jgi:transcriptional regulator with XRE-family HTH domain
VISDVRAGEGLRRLRTRAGLTTRQVAQLSHRIAAAEGDDEYAISHGRLIQIENGESTPSVYKLFTLSAIYGISFNSTVSLFADLSKIVKHQIDLGLDKTHLVNFPASHEERPLRFPVRFDPGLTADKTNLLSRMVQEWGEVPIAFLRLLDVRHTMYGFIGLGDYTMYPILRPGSFVQIEEQKDAAAANTTKELRALEFDRPIWFLELHDGYLCSWCEFRENRIISVPHPYSPRAIREFASPREAEVVGRVTAVAARLVNHAAALSNAPRPTQS